MSLWRTRDGRRLPLSGMDCAHLRNCLNKILRDDWRKPWLVAILAELDRRCKTPPPKPTSDVGSDIPKKEIVDA